MYVTPKTDRGFRRHDVSDTGHRPVLLNSGSVRERLWFVTVVDAGLRPGFSKLYFEGKKTLVLDSVLFWWFTGEPLGSDSHIMADRVLDAINIHPQVSGAAIGHDFSTHPRRASLDVQSAPAAEHHEHHWGAFFSIRFKTGLKHQLFHTKEKAGSTAKPSSRSCLARKPCRKMCGPPPWLQPSADKKHW